jgi:hypothetical protein
MCLLLYPHYIVHFAYILPSLQHATEENTVIVFSSTIIFLYVYLGI